LVPLASAINEGSLIFHQARTQLDG
jgi:hypothetical protein